MRVHIIPSIEQLRQRPRLQSLEATCGREAVVAALREEAARLRTELIAHPAGADALPADAEAAAAFLERRVADSLARAFRGSLRTVINATGVVIHTNLGRAPLAPAAIERLIQVARGYSNLEYDLEAGHRGRRDVHASVLLAQLTGADAAVVVNNNAAATLLILATLAAGREVVISRGELVEIGGGFRVPEVMNQSGAILREVGTTNRTRVADYEQAVTEQTALILRVHRSNFRIEGFTEQPTIEELVALGRRAGIPVVEDLGSGLLGDPERSESPNVQGGRLSALGFRPSVLSDQVREPDSAETKLQEPRAHGRLNEPLRLEPTVLASVGAGLDVVCFSGDKLLGGPQAGIIVGRRDLVDRIRRHPLTRALRVDKLTYAALEGTLLEYLAGRSATSIPVIRMLRSGVEAIRARAEAVRQAVGHPSAFAIGLRDGESMVGGGSAPGVAVPTCLIALEPLTKSATQIEAALRAADPPIIARVENETVLLDLRTVAPEEDAYVTEALKALR